MSRRPFLKDSIFYFAAVAWSASILIRRRIYYADAIGFIVLYLFYVITTWIFGALYKHQQKLLASCSKLNGEQISSSNSKWKRLTNQFNAYIVQKYRKFRLPRMLSKSDETTLVRETSTNVPNSAGAGTIISDADSSPNSQMGNGTTTNVKTVFPKAASGDVRLLSQPVIKITPVSELDSDGQVDPGQTFAADVHLHEAPISSTPHTERAFKMKTLSPEIQQKRSRASSVCTTAASATHNRLSAGTPILGPRDRCHRTQSVSRRRGSARMSTAGYELPYMVRWIIANREMEEKDLNASDFRQSRASIAGSEDAQSSVAHATQGSHKQSRILFTSTTVPVDSPPSSPSASEKIKTTTDETTEPSRKITIDLVPREADEGVKIGDGAGPDKYEKTESYSTSKTSTLFRWASKSVWHHLAYYMIPLDIESWYEQSIWSRIWQIVQAPLFLLFRLSIPTVLEDLTDEPDEKDENIAIESREETTRTIETVVEDGETDSSGFHEPKSFSDLDNSSQELDMEAMHGWCKPLNVFQCMLNPTLWVLFITYNNQSIGFVKISNSAIPVILPIFLVGLALALLVQFTSRWDEPPRIYHRPLFATMGFISSIIWIYAMAHELVNSLETLGIVWEISEAILGVSIMALASSIGDLMANTLLARNGYPRIAYAACLGSPLFNLLLGAGISYTIKIGRSSFGYASLSFTLTQAVLFSSLMVILVCNVIYMLIFRFYFHRIYGIFLMFVYLAFVVVAILIEVDVLKAPGLWKLATGTE